MTEHYHFVQHFLQAGDYVKTEFTCTAPENSTCRSACTLCYGEQLETCQCLYKDREPVIEDLGYCNVITWLSNDAPEEMYDGEDQPVRGPEPQPIKEVWLAEYYGWDYA